MATQREVNQQALWLNRPWALENLDNVTYRFLQQVVPILNEMYPDRFDIKFTFTHADNVSEGYAQIIRIQIKYPEITITNTNQERHEIKDLYVQLEFKRDSRTSIYRFNESEIRGIRQTVHITEYRCGYVHSHLPSANFSDSNQRSYWSTFCLGHGGMQQTLLFFRDECLPVAKADNNYTFDTNLFRLLFIQLNQYVKWESLEGGPHYRISQIGDREVVSEERSIDRSAKERVLSIIEKKYFLDSEGRLSKPTLTWTFNSDKTKLNLVVDRAFESFMNPEDVALYPRELNSLYGIFVYKDETLNQYYKPRLRFGITETEGSQIPTSYLFHFRGVEQNFSCYGTHQVEENLKEYIHPNISHYVARKLSDKINRAKDASYYFR